MSAQRADPVVEVVDGDEEDVGPSFVGSNAGDTHEK